MLCGTFSKSPTRICDSRVDCGRGFGVIEGSVEFHCCEILSCGAGTTRRRSSLWLCGAGVKSLLTRYSLIYGSEMKSLYGEICALLLEFEA